MRRGESLDPTDLRNLDDASANDYTQAEAFRQGVLETVSVGDVQIVDQGVIAVLPDDSFCGLAQEEGDVMGDWRKLMCERESMCGAAAGRIPMTAMRSCCALPVCRPSCRCLWSLWAAVWVKLCCATTWTA